MKDLFNDTTDDKTKPKHPHRENDCQMVNLNEPDPTTCRLFEGVHSLSSVVQVDEQQRHGHTGKNETKSTLFSNKEGNEYL